MHLKSLTLRGFKSFADRTNLKFEPGITVIVGPNGSGKSNITDGALWALGEQRPTSLRGSTMEDVIFAGSATRPALGMAEVIVCLDNSDNYLPIEFTDVTITRRVFRSGESEYFINNTPCRLIDVQELLSDTSLGKEMYTIIGQGQLEEILNGKPEDRRLLIEEVAQVLKHKRRRERALKKMEVMEHNLLRAKDILNEVDRQLKPLREQSNRAQNYQKMAEELKDLKIDQAVRELKELQDEWKQMLAREEELKNQITADKEKVDYHEGRIHQLQVELEEKGLYAGDLDEQQQRLRSIYEKLNTGLLLLEEKGKNLIARLSEIRQTVYQIESRKKQKEAEIARLEEKQSAYDFKLSALLKKLADLRKKAETVKMTLLETEQRFSDLEGDILEIRGNLMKKEDERSMFNLEITEAEGRLSLFKKRKIELKTSKASAVESLKKLKKQLTEAEKKKSQMASAMNALEKKMSEARESAARTQEEIEELNRSITEVETRLNALENIAQFYPTYPHFVAKTLLDKKTEIVGVLAELLEVDHGYERAIERALGDYLFSVIIKKHAEAIELLSLARESEAVFAAVFPLDHLKSSPKSEERPQTGLSALDVINVSPEHQALFRALLGHVWIVDSLAAAIKQKKKYPGLTFVSAKGEMIDEQGLITVSFADTSKFTILSSKAEMERNRQLRNDLYSALNKKENQLLKEKGAIEKLTEEISAIQAELIAKEHEIKMLGFERDSITDQLARLGEEESVLAEEMNELNQRLVQYEEMSAALRQEIKETYEKVELYQVELNSLSKEKNTWSKKENEISKALNECQLEINSLNEKQKDLKQLAVIASQEIEEQNKLLIYEQRVVAALEQLRTRIQPVHDQYTHLLHFVAQKIQLINDLSADEKKISFSIKQLLKESQEEIRRLTNKLENQTKVLSDLQLFKGQLEVKVTNAVQKIVEEYELPLEKALEVYPKDLPQSEIETKVKRLQIKIAALGPVNPVAVEQFNEASSRYDFLKAQINDLIDSKRALNRVITAIDKKIKEQFLETFEEVNVSFQKVFNYLFPGGRAELILTDSDDPLNSGIEIEAQPSGKKLKKLSLLSGGERALVALALLFAIHEIRPSPFYILDEVEPALDDVNLQRFISLLKKMRRETQFLIISHQRRTMEIADSLYGVSMQADGVSKVFSQKLKPVKEAG